MRLLSGCNVFFSSVKIQLLWRMNLAHRKMECEVERKGGREMESGVSVGGRIK